MVTFVLQEYVDDAIALARVRARMVQEELTPRMNVTGAYFKKFEDRTEVTPALPARINVALRRWRVTVFFLCHLRRDPGTASD